MTLKRYLEGLLLKLARSSIGPRVEIRSPHSLNGMLLRFGVNLGVGGPSLSQFGVNLGVWGGWGRLVRGEALRRLHQIDATFSVSYRDTKHDCL